MDRMLQLIGDVGDPRQGGADSFCDRLNCIYTVSILAIFSIIITTRQYVGEPISCWCPAEYKGSMVDYANMVCWTTSTYFLPFEVDDIPEEDDKRRRISYYQWVSFILVCQAFMFYIPRALWRVFNKKTGIAVFTITDAAIERQKKSSDESADKIMRYMVKHMGRFLLEVSRSILNRSRCRMLWQILYGNYLFGLYIVIKLLYIGNVIGQIFLMNAFLGADYHYYGIDVMRRMVRGETWTTSVHFPLVTLCDFHIREPGGNLHRHTVQCSLPMNLLHEMFFIFLWFWLLFVGTATLVSLIMWLITCSYLPNQTNYVRNRLIAMDYIKSTSDREMDRIQKFVTQYLKRDGCFIIRLVAKNASDVAAAELIGGLWKEFGDSERKIDRLFSNNEAELEEMTAASLPLTTIVQRNRKQ